MKGNINIGLRVMDTQVAKRGTVSFVCN